MKLFGEELVGEALKSISSPQLEPSAAERPKEYSLIVRAAIARELDSWRPRNFGKAQHFFRDSECGGH